MKFIDLYLVRYLETNQYHYYEKSDWSDWRLVMLDSNEDIDESIKQFAKNNNISLADYEYKRVDEDRLIQLLYR